MKDQKYLKECFSYNYKTGDLTWKTRPRSHFNSNYGYNPWNRKHEGAVAGTITDQGYMSVTVCYKRLKAHRVVWCLVNGVWPNGEIDHIDGNTLNNKIENLRVVTHKENMKNQKVRVSNKSGLIGVHWSNDRCKWVSSISKSGKLKCIGRFHDKFEAICARKSAEVLYDYHDNHGAR